MFQVARESHQPLPWHQIGILNRFTVEWRQWFRRLPTSIEYPLAGFAPGQRNRGRSRRAKGTPGCDSGPS